MVGLTPLSTYILICCVAEELFYSWFGPSYAAVLDFYLILGTVPSFHFFLSFFLFKSYIYILVSSYSQFRVISIAFATGTSQRFKNGAGSSDNDNNNDDDDNDVMMIMMILYRIAYRTERWEIGLSLQVSACSWLVLCMCVACVNVCDGR